MRANERGSVAQVFFKLLLLLVVVGLVGAIGYLLSDINTHRYRLALANEGLVVERGRFLPVGFERFEPVDEVQRRAYAPIEVPPNEQIDTSVVFEDRSEIDRALYSRLRPWAALRLESRDGPTLELGIRYVKRLEMLPGLSEGQRHELRAMRADAALKQAEGLLEGVHQALRQAVHLFEQAVELGTSDADRARTGLEQCHEKLKALADDPKATPRAPTPALWPTPAPAP